MSRKRKVQSSLDDRDSSFMEDLEESLLKTHELSGLDAFEAVFNKKKKINIMIDKEKKLKEDAIDAYQKARQRVAQIQQLQMKVDKQTALLKLQVEKINDAHSINKILMMQKIVKLQKETNDIEKKKSMCYQGRCERERSNLSTITRKVNKIERLKLLNMSKTDDLRQEMSARKHQTKETNRKKADSVRMDRDRRNTRLQKIEEFKLDRARKNYQDKVENLLKTVDKKELELGKLSTRQQIGLNNLESAQNISNEYLNSFFPTSALL